MAKADLTVELELLQSNGFLVFCDNVMDNHEAFLE
jgi:hypothetical protein